MSTGIVFTPSGSTDQGESMSQFVVRGAAGAQGTLLPDGSGAAARVNGRGEQIVAQGLPERAELVRMGQSWHYSIPTGSAFTTVAAWPTTRSELNLTNMAAAGGPSMVIDQVWAATIVTETAASALTIIVQVSPVNLVASAAVVDNSAVLARCLNGKAGALNRAPNIAATIASTAYGIASQWHVPRQYQAGTNLAAVSVGQASIADLNGLYVIQPGASFAVNAVVGTAVASAGIMGVVFHLAELDLGS
jgi:hypothetical protein